MSLTLDTLAIPLDRAVLCEDCQCITLRDGNRCTYCNSTAIMSLTLWLQPIKLEAS
jgi:hypothetical protein